MITFLCAIRHKWNAGTPRGPPEPMDQSPSSQLWLQWIMLIVVWASVRIFHHQQSDSYASACPDEFRSNGQDDVILMPTNQRRALVYNQHLQPPTDRLVTGRWTHVITSTLVYSFSADVHNFYSYAVYLNIILEFLIHWFGSFCNLTAWCSN